MVDIYFNSGGVLFREGKAAISTECCCGCCCKDGQIDRSIKFQKPCEDAGGTWGPCPGATVCNCQCDASVTINGVSVAAGDPGDDATYTALGTETVTIPLAGFDVQWRFSAITQTFCLDPGPFGRRCWVVVIILRVQLWTGNGGVYSNYTLPFGSYGYGAYAWEFLYEQQAEFDGSPNSWPCPTATPTLLNGSPAGPDTAAIANHFGGFGINFNDPSSDGWDDEYEAAVDAYLVTPSPTIDCSWNQPCE